MAVNKYVVGNDITLADFNILAGLDPVEAAQIDISSYPNIVRWRTELMKTGFLYEMLQRIRGVSEANVSAVNDYENSTGAIGCRALTRIKISVGPRLLLRKPLNAKLNLFFYRKFLIIAVIWPTLQISMPLPKRFPAISKPLINLAAEHKVFILAGSVIERSTAAKSL